MKLPNEWHIVPLHEIAYIQTGLAKGKPYTVETVRLPYLRVANVQDGYFDLNEIKEIEVAVKDVERYSLKSGDVLFTEGGDFDKLGRGDVWRGQIPVCLHQNHVFAVRPEPSKLLPEFLAYLSASPYGRRFFIGASKQSTNLASINSGQLKEFPIPLPPLEEQRKIAAILSTWDEAIGVVEQLIAALGRRKQALMQLLLMGAVRFAGFEGEWEEVELGATRKSMRYSFTGGPFGSNLKAQEYTDSGVRIIQLQNIGDGEFLDDYKIYTSESKADELLSCNIYPGDIIISKMGDPVARATFIPSIEPRYVMASDGIRLVVDDEKYDPRYVLEYINSPVFRKQAVSHSTGSTRQRIKLDDLKSLLLHKPPLEEQTEIAKLLNSCNEEINLLRRFHSVLREQKRGLMQQLLTGAVRV